MRVREELYRQRLERTALNPLAQTARGYYALILVLLAVAGWGLYAYIVQLRFGLLATGMRDQVMWGLYLVNFVFFIGISHAGTLISAILRVTQAGWRTPVTRLAELITVVAISIGALMPIIDLGRPERVMNMLWFGRFQSPLLWDIVSIGSYLSGSLILPGGIISPLLLLVGTVMLIWFTYFRVIYQVFRIPIVSEIRDIDTRLIPLVGLAIVALVGTVLALMLLTAPYTHLHLLR